VERVDNTGVETKKTGRRRCYYSILVSHASDNKIHTVQMHSKEKPESKFSAGLEFETNDNVDPNISDFLQR
jgi:hypothetical protein